MSTLSKADYLKRYLSGEDVKANDNSKKKKKKSKSSKPARESSMRIMDDDAFIEVAGAQKEESESEEDEVEVKVLNEVRTKEAEPSKFKSAFAPVEGVSSKESESQRRRRDSDASPPRRGGRADTDSDADVSPPRRRQRHDSDADESPPRRPARHDSDASPPRRRRQDSDGSPPRRRVRQDSVASPPRRRQRRDSDASPPRRQRRDSDASPPRRRARRDSDNSPPRRRQRHDSDESPPRKRTGGKETDLSPVRKQIKREPSSDVSPVRRGRKDSPDLSPARKRVKEEPLSPTPSTSADARQKTLDGKVAGLQTAAALKEESRKLKKKEDELFENLDADRSGRHADTVTRTKLVGGRKEKPEDKERKEREAKKQEELKEKYKSWNKGVKQLQERDAKLHEAARVAAEPLTRRADDEAMNEHLKDLLLEGDPMEEIMMKKRQKDDVRAGKLIYPTYRGSFPPNRFGIRPGYRWDGVPRGNGFEGKIAVQANRRAADERSFYENIQTYE